MKRVRILVINPKGGCGKTTLATNLASYYAVWDVPVALIDYDSQRSSLDWLEQRGGDLNNIEGIDGSRGRINLERRIRRVVMDAPARTGRAQLARLMELADAVLVPVLPSPIDIRAAGQFIDDLAEAGLPRRARIGLVGNRVREHTRVFGQLRRFLRRSDIRLVSSLRDTQNYIRAADSGLGIFEMPPHQSGADIRQWRPIINWIEN